MENERRGTNPWRKDFPLLMREPVIYFDSAATAQKPFCVLEAERRFYEESCANPLRGLYALGAEATECLERARRTVQKFLHAAHAEEIIFTRNATESLNLIAYSYGLGSLEQGDEILVSILEHHSNLLPWQMAAKQTGAVLRFLECGPDGSIGEEELQRGFTERTKLVAVTHVSNVLGIKTPVERIVSMAHERGAVVVLDAAQSAPHGELDVQALPVDFLAFSGHKLMGPMGIGVLYGRRELLEKMPPFLRGGEMIEHVTRAGAAPAELPYKFEAGTVNAAGAAGLEAAIRYLWGIGFETIEKQETRLTAYAMKRLRDVPFVRLLGREDPADHSGILTFTMDGVHPHDVSAVLDADRIAVRAGHHCAQPLMDFLKLPAATRVSLAFYNTEEEIDLLAESLRGVRRKMGYGE